MTNTDDQLLGQDDLAMKETYKFSTYNDEDEDDYEDEDDDNKSKNLNKTRKHGSHHPFKLKIMDIEEISWKKFTQLLRQEFYSMGYVQDRWTRWHNLRLQRGQNVQEYTIEFRRLAVTLGIAIDNVDIFTKYVAGLPLQIQNEKQLHVITNISNASSIVMAIEQKNKVDGRKFEEGLKGEGSNSSHHMKDYKKKGVTHSSDSTKYHDHRRRTTATAVVDEVIELESVKEADKSLSLMAKLHMKSLDTHPLPLGTKCGVFQKSTKVSVGERWEKFLINRNNDVRNIELITACQARRMVNTTQAVLLSLARPMASSNNL
nr:hypothetical protein [Tanacetum cinerariifolium]